MRQATYGTPGIDTLDDDQLAELHRTLERGRECCIDGVSLDDAGLIQSRA